MNWKYSNGHWCATRPYHDGICDFIYAIFGNEKDGYTAEATNNAFGAHRVAVRSRRCRKESIFNSLEELKEKIENGTQLWLYTGVHDRCFGEITTKEY